jgi:hypothetical protein
MSTSTERTGSEPASIEQRLKAQIDSYPIRLRPDLAREAYQAHRLHRVIRRSTAAGTLAVVAAIGVIVATGAVPFSGAAQRPSTVTSQAQTPGQEIVPPASFQPTPAPDSLSAQQAAKDIFFMRQTTSRAHLVINYQFNNLWQVNGVHLGDNFFYGNEDRNVDYNADGTPANDNMIVGVTGKDGKLTPTQTMVNYRDHTWLRGPGPSPALNTFPSGLCAVAQVNGLDSEDPTLLMKGARSLLTCHGLTVTRGVSVDGIAAIKISRPNSALWINATTYLPIQAEAGGPGKTDTTQFGYLPPTPANQTSYLSVFIPPGFTRDVFFNPQSPTPEPTNTAPVQPWTPPAGTIPPFGLQPVPAGNDLTVAQAKGDILWSRFTTEAIPASDTVIDNIFDYKSASRHLTYYPGGKPWDDDSTAVIRSADGTLTTTHTVVLYNKGDKGTYSYQTTPGGSGQPQSQASCGTELSVLDFQATPDAARALLSCQNLTVTRGLTIDGVNAITIATKDGTEKLWINATTYLPIQLVIVDPKGLRPPTGYNNTPSPGKVQQFTFLPPTPTNLSYLVSPIPAGFTMS